MNEKAGPGEIRVGMTLVQNLNRFDNEYRQKVIDDGMVEATVIRVEQKGTGMGFLSEPQLRVISDKEYTVRFKNGSTAKVPQSDIEMGDWSLK